MNQYNVSPISPGSQKEPSGAGWTPWLLAIPMVVCCGLPYLVAALAAASILIKGVLLGVGIVVVGAVAVFLIRRSIRSKVDCFSPPVHATTTTQQKDVDRP